MNHRPTQAAFYLPLLAFAWLGCTSAESNSPVGDMADTSYYGQRDSVTRPNARGRLVSLDQFEGRFIWSDYAAPWCSPCVPQTKAVKSVERSFGTDVVFVTVMTSDAGGYGDPATVNTASRWAARFRLDPDRVLAADLTAMTIPKNILFSPDGHVLFEHVGLMDAAEIRSTLERYMTQFNNWKEQGVVADWMRSGY